LKMKKLSILIPVYNAEKYISSLLDCIIPQMDDSMEVILINDGSCDSSKDICSKYEARYPLLIRFLSRDNKGAVYTRRELFKAAIGEWIWIVDSDDTILHNSLDIIMDAIIQNDSCDLFLFDYYKNTADKNAIVHQLPSNDGDIFFDKKKKVLYEEIICGTNLNQLWNKVFKRECIDFDVDYSEYEDVKKANDCLQMMPIITNAQCVMYKQSPIYIYNTNNEDSLSHKFHDYTYTSLKKVWARKKEFVCKWEVSDELQEVYYKQGAMTAVHLLKKYALSEKTNQEYCFFFEKLMNDGVFSEAIENCDEGNIYGIEKMLIKMVKSKRKRLTYFLFQFRK